MDTLVICQNCEKANRVPLERARQTQPNCGNCKKQLPFHDGIQDVSGATLSILVRKSLQPVIVDFWAPWCGPCRNFSPTFQAAAEQMGGKAAFAKLNTEAFPQAGETYGVRGIPTLIVFKGGTEIDRQSGAFPLDAFLKYLNRWVNS